MVEKILSIDDCWGHSVVSEDAVSEKLPMLIQATVKLTEFRKKQQRNAYHDIAIHLEELVTKHLFSPGNSRNRPDFIIVERS